MEQTHNVVSLEKYILTSLLGEDGDFNGVHISEYFKLIELADDYFIRLGCKQLPYNVGECELHSWFITNAVAYAEPVKTRGKIRNMKWRGTLMVLWSVE